MGGHRDRRLAGPGGNLAATEAAVTRVRTALEASRELSLPARGVADAERWGCGTTATPARHRLDVGYGADRVGRRFVGTPTVGVGTAADGRDYRLGYRLGALGGEGTTVELGVEAQRRERPRQAGTDHGRRRARATLRW